MRAVAVVRASMTQPRLLAVSSSPSLVLFLCVFTSQAAVLVLSPVLVEVARDLHVSTAAAGQLRIVAAPVAAAVAVLVARFGGQLPLRSLLSAGAALVGGGSIASAAAPSFVGLALAQVPLWIGVAVLVAGGVGAAGSWTAPEARSRVVAHALAGAPAAWIVGMPGLVAEVNWRLAFLAVPLPAAVATGAILLAGRPERSERRADASLVRLLREPGARGWAFGEFLAMSSWAGMLVFSGALFVESYGASTRLTGLLLALVALAYLAGTTLGGRIHENCHLRRALARGNVAAAAAVALTWLIRPSLFVTLASSLRRGHRWRPDGRRDRLWVCPGRRAEARSGGGALCLYAPGLSRWLATRRRGARGGRFCRRWRHLRVALPRCNDTPLLRLGRTLC
jgi:MFS transporter, DHA1 family, inner membrane transport protein